MSGIHPHLSWHLHRDSCTGRTHHLFTHRPCPPKLLYACCSVVSIGTGLHPHMVCLITLISCISSVQIHVLCPSLQISACARIFQILNHPLRHLPAPVEIWSTLLECEATLFSMHTELRQMPMDRVSSAPFNFKTLQVHSFLHSSKFTWTDYPAYQQADTPTPTCMTLNHYHSRARCSRSVGVCVLFSLRINPPCHTSSESFLTTS